MDFNKATIDYGWNDVQRAKCSWFLSGPIAKNLMDRGQVFMEQESIMVNIRSTRTRGLHTKGVKNCNTISLGQPKPVKCNEGLSEDGPRKANGCNNGIYASYGTKFPWSCSRNLKRFQTGQRRSYFRSCYGLRPQFRKEHGGRERPTRTIHQEESLREIVTLGHRITPHGEWRATMLALREDNHN